LSGFNTIQPNAIYLQFGGGSLFGPNWTDVVVKWFCNQLNKNGTFHCAIQTIGETLQLYLMGIWILLYSFIVILLLHYY